MALREIILELGVDVEVDKLDAATNAIDSLKDGAVKLAALFTTGAVAVGFKNLIGFASAGAERINKFGAVFQDSSEGIQQKIDEISARTKIAAPLLQSFTANLGAITKPALGSAKAAGELAAAMSEAALDIASFNDVEPSDAFVAIRSGLIGSAEPLQRFGVDVRVAALEAEALRLGIKGSIQAMTEGQRVQLRSSAILRQLGSQGALGDATRTSDELANATRGLNSQLMRMAEFIGGFFLADARDTTVRLRDIVTAMNAWILANRELIQQRVDKVLQVINNTIKAIEFGIRFLIGAFGTLSEVIGPVAANVLAAVAAIAVLVAILGAPIVAILALGAAIGLVIDDLVIFAEGGESVFGLLVDGITEFLGRFDEVGPAFESLITMLGTLFQSFFADADEATGGFLTGIFEKAIVLWDSVVTEWLPVLDNFFATALIKIEEFAKVGVEKARELFGTLGRFIAESLKNIFSGTIGRIIIDLLGAKAGAVVGEFIGRLVGKLLGQITGKGIVGRAISSRISEELFALAGKGAGAIAGGLGADELALGLREFLTAPPAAIAPAVAGGTSMVNQPNMETNINITASGANADPPVIGGVVKREIAAANELLLRQTRDAFTVAKSG